MKLYKAFDGGELVAFGTAAEVAEKLGVSVQTVYFYASPAYHGRVNGKSSRRVVVAVGDKPEAEHSAKSQGNRTAVVCRHYKTKKSGVIVSEDNPARCPFCGMGFSSEEE